MKVDSHVRVFFAVVLILVAFRSCVAKTTSEESERMMPAVKEGELAKVVFDGRTRTITTSHQKRAALPGARVGGAGTEAPAQTRRSDGTRGGSVVLYPNGRIETFTLHKGFWWGPGLSAAYAGDRLRVGIDAEIAWYRRWSAFIGFNVSTDFSGRGYIAGGYNIYGNSHLFVGIDTEQDFLVGLRTSF